MWSSEATTRGTRPPARASRRGCWSTTSAPGNRGGRLAWGRVGGMARRVPPLLSEHPRSIQVFLAVVLPAVYGAATGYFLGVSEVTYLVLSLIGVVGGIGAGFDHRGALAGAKRGVLAGSIFGAAILIAHEIHGAEAKADLPEPPSLLVLITTVLAVAFAALGGWLRERAERKGAARGPEVPGPLG